MARALAAAALCELGCGAPNVAQRTEPGPALRTCEYRVGLSALGVAKVNARCWGTGDVTFRVANQALTTSVKSSAARGNQAGSWRARSGGIDYQIDLAALAARGASIDTAAHVGKSFVAPLSSLLLVPEPLTTEISVTVQFEPEAGVQLTTGLLRGDTPGSYRLMAHELPVATYLAFGKLEQRILRVPAPSGASGSGHAELHVAKLDGPTALPFEAFTSWVQKSADAVSAFYAGFPVPHASLLVVPVPARDGIVFGKLLPASAPGIALLAGEHADSKALASDWILIHELFHLGSPSFNGEGKWLDEGLATYYEPIVRVRAGLYTEAKMWDEFARSLPQGLPAYTEFGLEQASDFRGVYWGGAIACLVADVEARKRAPGRGLEFGLIALLKAGGNASAVWSVADAISSIDGALGAPILGKVAQRHAAKGSPFDLQGLLRELGVSRDRQGALQLSDRAPLAAIRRAITAARE